MALLASGDPDRAIAKFDEILRIEPENASARAGRGFAHAYKGYRGRAIDDGEVAIRLAPGLGLGYAVRAYARAQAAQPDFSEVIADCDRAIRLDPSSAACHAIRGYVISRRAYATNRRPEPGRGVVPGSRNVGDPVKGDLEQNAAIAECDEAIRLDPRYLPAYLFLGIARKNRGEYDLAIASFDEAIRINPDGALAYALRAMVWNNRSEHDKALADCDRAIRLDPGLTEAYSARLSALARKGDMERIEITAKELRRLLAEPGR